MQKALRLLEEHASYLIQNESEQKHLPLMRNKAGELDVDLDVKDSDLETYLLRAEAALTPVQVYRKGEKLQATESVFLLEGMLKLGESNVIIGQPKVGKSSFSTGLIAAIRDRRETFLGRELLLPNERMPVLIFGTDQSEGDWLHFLRRESLVNDDMTLSDSVDFFCSMEAGQKFNFTKEGIRAMRQEIDQHACPLVIIDSLSSMMEPTGIEENTSRFAQPIRSAISELRKTGATLLIIHHSVKRPNTWDWIQECRGSSSISSVFSWGVLMRWVAQEDDGLMRTDRRVGFAGKGRGSGESGGVMGRYEVEGGWTYLDGLEEAQQVERMRQRIAELGGVRAQVFDYITMRTELNADVSNDELATELNKTRSAMGRETRNLISRGLVSTVRQEETGVRPRSYFRLSIAAEEAMSPGGVCFANNASFPLETLKTSFSTFREAENSPSDPPKETTHLIPVKSPVERLIGDEWQAGWLVRDGRNPDAVTVEKLGNPNIIVKNLRWDLDLRPASATFAQPSDPLPF